MDEPDETIKIKLSALSQNVRLGSSSTGTGTIKDDDAAPTVTLSLSPTTIHESDQTDSAFDSSVSKVTASLSHASAVQITVTVSATAGTNAVSGDFALSPNKTLRIAPGSRSSTGRVTVSAVDNSVSNASKQVTVSGSVSGGVSGSTSANPASQTLTIQDDDSEPTLSIDSPSVSEGDSGSKPLTFTVSLSPASDSAVTVKYADAGTGTATAGTDYTALTAGSLTFAAGDTYKTISIQVTGDVLGEPDETVRVTLSDPVNAVLGAASTGVGTIRNDNDTPTVGIDSPSVSEGDSGEVDLDFTVSLSAASGQQVTVGYAVDATDGGTATAGTDYTALAAGTATIAAGSSSTTVTVKVKGDTTDEPNETVRLTLSGPTNATLDAEKTTGTGTITDDDAAPTVTLALTPSTIDESDQDAGTPDTSVSAVSASLSHASAEAITVSVAAATGANAASGDYTLSENTTLTIAAGATSSTETVTVSAVDNAKDEADKQVTVSGTVSGGVSGSASANPSSQTLTITDDDAAPTVSIGSASVAEGDSGEADLDFTVSLSAASGKQVTVNYAVDGTDGGTATSGADYAAVTETTLTFAVGDTSKTVTVKAKGDTTDEPDETVRLTLSEPGNATLGSASTGVGTITDDDAAPTVSIGSASAAEGDSGEADLDFTVSLSAASGKRVTVNYAVDGTDGGTATSGTDYAAVTETTLTFAVGDTSKTATVRVKGDATDEPDETVRLTLSAPGNATLGSTSTGVGTITDDDAAPTVGISSPSVAEGDSGQAHLDFTVSLSAASGKQVTVNYAPDGTDAGTATSGTDYTAVSQTTLTFAAGEISKRARVLVTGDTADEPNETVKLTLSGPANATLDAAKTTGTGTITDDDAAPTVTLSLTPSTIDESDQDAGTPDTSVSAVSASLSHASAAAITVSVAAAAGTNAASGDFALSANTALTIAAGDTASTGTAVTVSAVDNAKDEADKQVTVSATVSGGVSGSASADPPSRTLTIRDDDGAPTVGIDSPSAAEGDSGQAHLDFTVSLSAVSGKQVTVKYAPATNAGTATSGTDYTAVSQTTLTFAVGETSKTVRVLVTGDATDEPDETVRLTLSGPTNATLDATKTTGVGTITDDDDPPTVSIGSASVAEGDSGEADLEFTVSLSAASGKQVTVKYAVDGTDAGTATSGTDYEAVTETTLTFAVGDTSKTVTVKVKGDTLNEPNETVRLTLSEPANATLGSASTGVGMITDDDGAPTVSISSPSVAEGDSGSANLDFMVTLSAASGRQVTVKYAPATNAGTATAGTDYAAVSQTTCITPKTYWTRHGRMRGSRHADKARRLPPRRSLYSGLPRTNMGCHHGHNGREETRGAGILEQIRPERNPRCVRGQPLDAVRLARQASFGRFVGAA